MLHRTPPNYIKQFEGFYISYNPVDVEAYGDVTTALVTDDMTHFYILNGNHMHIYEELGPEGFERCLDYFAANEQAHNKHSDPINAMVVTAKDGTVRYAKGAWDYVGGEYKFTLEGNND